MRSVSILALFLLTGCAKAVWGGNCEPNEARNEVKCHVTNSGNGKGHVCFESTWKHVKSDKTFTSKTVCSDVKPGETFQVKPEFEGVDIVKECGTKGGGWACAGTMSARYDE